MKRTLLVAINTKFIHSNLAIRYIKKYVDREMGMEEGESTISLMEFSINQQIDYILSEIIDYKPELVTFSCYLWNIEYVRNVSRELKKILKNIIIVYGGPEVSYTAEEELEINPSVDIVIKGEGEETFRHIFENLSIADYLKGEGYGYSYRSQDGIKSFPPAIGLPLEEIPFPYDKGFKDLDNRILYYETSRGCPFHCQYCLSSIEKGVRFRPLDLVYKELQFFLDHKVRQVKFVDRTFNAKQSHALGIMNYIIEHDNGVTNFHFEVAPELLKEGFIECLSRARKGLFQLEIGVQTTHERTLQLIQRKNVLPLITKAVMEVHKLKNTHMHLDLIAGLPDENYQEFNKSFDYVYSLKPHQLQLGFLKVLKGSGMMKLTQPHGILYREYPPYQVLETKTISYHQLKLLNMVEEMVEIFYNSGQFRTTMDGFVSKFDSPFKAYEYLAMEWMNKGFHHEQHNKLSLYQFLYDITDDKERLMLDYCLNEKPRKKLEWMDYDFIEAPLQRVLLDAVAESDYWQEEASEFTTKQLSRIYHMDTLKTMTGGDPIDRLICSHERYEGDYLLINYGRRDFIHKSGEMLVVTINRQEEGC